MHGKIQLFMLPAFKVNYFLSSQKKEHLSGKCQSIIKKILSVLNIEVNKMSTEKEGIFLQGNRFFSERSICYLLKNKMGFK